MTKSPDESLRTWMLPVRSLVMAGGVLYRQRETNTVQGFADEKQVIAHHAANETLRAILCAMTGAAIQSAADALRGSGEIGAVTAAHQAAEAAVCAWQVLSGVTPPSFSLSAGTVDCTRR